MKEKTIYPVLLVNGERIHCLIYLLSHRIENKSVVFVTYYSDFLVTN